MTPSQPPCDIQIVIRIPTAEWCASETGVEIGSSFWEQFARAHRAAQLQFYNSDPWVPDPRDFRHPQPWRDKLRQQLGLLELGMCIQALSTPSTDVQDSANATPFFFATCNSFLRRGWINFQHHVDRVGSRAVAVVFLGYPHVAMNNAALAQSVTLGRPFVTLQVVREYLDFRDVEIARRNFERPQEMEIQASKQDDVNMALDELSLGEDFSWALNEEMSD